MPVRSRFTICVDDEASRLRTGPKMPAGLMTTSSSAPPSALMKSQAARSAISFDLTYALMSPRSGFRPVRFVERLGARRITVVDRAARRGHHHALHSGVPCRAEHAQRAVACGGDAEER